MRDSNRDLRVMRTKESIRDSLVELIEEKGFKAITVKDITTRANINRGTFYAHYQDKFDLMTKCQEEIMSEMLRIGKEYFPQAIEELRTSTLTSKPFTLTVLMFEYLNDNSRFMKAILGPKGDLSFQTELKKFMWNTLFEHEMVKQENLCVPEEYLISYVSSAHIGVIQQWLNSGGKESPEKMAQILLTITANGPFVAAGLKK
ncbi:TetR/AcrR family transcriptional regulator [Priestia endophytica]|uniref:TetR/AcrR family transcriptional regulator n=1 Tax=Priestia endophytica TaxID=135735 RepID=UPI00227E93E1|nr:TetR/AcrR family transcriptional regulator [Priestia endophytica]MCY8235304.1 TetR/AcrR family transcriptional regulator [Priestia endophytica]